MERKTNKKWFWLSIPVLIISFSFVSYTVYSMYTTNLYQNKIKVVEIYAQNQEFDKALHSLEELLLQNPNDEKVNKLYQSILQIKRLEEEEKRVIEELKQKNIEQEKSREKAELYKTMNRLFSLFDTVKQEENESDIIFLTTKTEQLLSKGIKQYDNGDYRKAKKSFEEVLKLNPGSYIAESYLSAIVYYEDPTKKDTLKLSEEKAKSSLRRNNDIELSHLVLARVYTVRGENEKAIYEYKEVIRLNDKNADACFSLAKLYYSGMNYSECKVNVEKYRVLKPNDPLAYFYLGMCDYRLGNKDKGKKEIVKSITIDSGFYQGYFELATIYFQEKEYARSIDYSEKANLIQKKFEHYYMLGECSYAIGKLSNAEGYFNKALLLSTISSTDAVNKVTLVYQRLVQIQIHNKQITKAFAYIDEGLKLNNNSAELFILSGKIKAGQDRYDEAIIDYQKAVSIQNDNCEAFTALGMLYNKAGKFIDAYNMGQKGLLLDDNQYELYLVIGDSLKGVKDISAALLWYQKGIDKVGELAVFHYRIGLCYKEENAMAKAVECFEKSILLDKTYPESYYELGECYIALTRYEKAKDMLLTLSSLNSGYSKKMKVDQKLRIIEKQLNKKKS